MIAGAATSDPAPCAVVSSARPLRDGARAPAAVPAGQAIVRLLGVSRTFGDTVAVRQLDLDIRHGEFFTFLGPSGSGKTTTLRMIAGLERTSSGRIEIAGVDVTRVPPFSRDVNTVFQDYALFPHMTVAKNIAYGLEVGKRPRKEIAERVARALHVVQLEGHANKMPSQLSGGQRQRVALARAFINQPSVLLLDEPLGALDLKLRREMQVELKRIQQALEISFIYVTHDQEEALTMSDRIAVFNQGRIEQVGEPAILYERPASDFVAKFVGSSNLFDLDGKRVMVRPEKMRILGPDEAVPGATWMVAPGVVTACEFVGAFMRYHLDMALGTNVLVVEPNSGDPTALQAHKQGEHVRVAWPHGSAYEIPAHPDEGDNS